MNIEHYGPADFNNFAALIEQLRAAIGPGKLITSCFAAAPAKLQGFNWARLNNSMDYFDMMTYDYNGGWSNKAGHNAPLYDYPGAEYSGFSLDATTALYKPVRIIPTGLKTNGTVRLTTTSSSIKQAVVPAGQTIGMM
jgi:chitinase